MAKVVKNEMMNIVNEDELTDFQIIKWGSFEQAYTLWNKLKKIKKFNIEATIWDLNSAMCKNSSVLVLP